MSITNEFQNTADWVAGYAYRREPIPWHTAGRLASVLLDLADRAKLLERVPVPQEPVVYAPCEADDAD